MNRIIISFYPAIFFLILSCGLPNNDPLVMDWILMEDVNQDLLESITVFSGNNKHVPLRAWYVDIDLSSSRVAVDIAVSGDTDLRTTPADFLDSLNATIVVNGGYFLMRENPTKHIGLLTVDGGKISPVVNRVGRNGLKYYVSRGALEFLKIIQSILPGFLVNLIPFMNGKIQFQIFLSSQLNILTTQLFHTGIQFPHYKPDQY